MNPMNRVALVTGSSRGIGRAIAAQLAREGYAVVINYYERRDKAEELAAQLAREGCRALAVQADVEVITGGKRGAAGGNGSVGV